MIYFVLPVFNEEKNIRNLILTLRQKMEGKSYKIIAVNDGSTDGSLKILNELKDPNLIIETYFINMNVGAVFSQGIRRVLLEAKDDDVMIIMESDQTSEIGFVGPLVAAIEEKGNDIMIASRYHQGGEYVKFPFLRKIFSYSANYLMKFFFPIDHISDYTIFFRAYRVGVLRKMVSYFGQFGLIQSKGFVANAELLIKAAFFTQRIVEIPFVYDYSLKKGKSKINILRTINEYFVLISYLRRIFKKIENWKKIHHVKGVLG
ncbi:MAG: glycosyltransferase [Candidatus Omnitrophica bacterium]|nr:glycosyltransferase [Candidatus Omnitrophota bacterium]